ncbi:MAG TPA: hypothetical protein VF581_06450 [Flavobacterium sp.]|jgi:hypothetical protein
MRKFLLFILFACVLNGCSHDDREQANYVLMPVESADVPTNMAVGETAEITVYYRRPTDCHFFDDFFIEHSGLTTTIGIQAVVMNRDDCMEDSANLYEVDYIFTPESIGDYHFKLWTGTENGIAQYQEYTVIVE